MFFKRKKNQENSGKLEGKLQLKKGKGRKEGNWVGGNWDDLKRVVAGRQEKGWRWAEEI